MAIQISGAQIKNNAVSSTKMDLSSGTFDFSSATVTVATPTADAQAATKAYVDAIASGLSWKAPVKVASTGNLTLSGTQIIDGVAVSVGDRVLVKDQTSGSESDNGIYVVASGSWSRSADMDADADFPSASVFVQQGTVNADVGYVCTNDSVSLGSTAITFVQFNGASNIVAGDALSKVGNTLDVNVDGVTIEIASDALQIKDAGVGTAKLADGSVESAKIASGAVTSAKIATSAVGSTQLSDGSVTSSKIVDGAVVGVKLADGAVTSAKIGDAQVTNAKLANSTISGVSLGGTLGAFSAGATSLITMTSYDGSAGVSDIDLSFDGLMFEKNGSYELSIKDGAINTSQLSNSAVTTAKLADASVTNAKLGSLAVQTANIKDANVTTAKIADANVTTAKIADSAVTNAKLAGSITADKLTLGNGVQNNSGSLQANIDATYLAFDSGAINISFQSRWKTLAADNSTTTFDLDASLKAKFSSIMVFKNGIALEQVASGASGSDQFSITASGGTAGVGQVVFGSAPSSSDNIRVFYIA